LKSLDWRGAKKISFSPDSRYLAFDLPTEESSNQRDVFIIGVDGSSLISAVTHLADDSVVGWSPDGKYLLFASDRTGKTAIYAVAFESGKVQGTATILNSDVGLTSFMGVSRSGTLYYGVGNGSRDLLTASVDFESGKVLTPPFQAVNKFVNVNYNPEWSPDGHYLSYESYGDRKDLLIAIQSLKTGETRDIRPRLTSFNFPRWLSDGNSFVAQGTDLKGRQGLYRIDAHTGDIAGMVMSTPGQAIVYPVSSADGNKVYYFRGADGRQTPKTLVEYDITSNVERQLSEAKCSDALSIAWDGRFLACGAVDPASKELVLLVSPVSGGASRELLRLKPGNALNFPFIQWTPDGRFIVFGKDGEVWVTPVSGGQARKVDLVAAPVLDLRIHPDNRRIVFTTRIEKKSEVWAMENFLPTIKTQK
jgi:Tol biopolymer transport system component